VLLAGAEPVGVGPVGAEPAGAGPAIAGLAVRAGLAGVADDSAATLTAGQSAASASAGKNLRCTAEFPRPRNRRFALISAKWPYRQSLRRSTMPDRPAPTFEFKPWRERRAEHGGDQLPDMRICGR
jgi:hypothetical protein